MSKTQLPGMAAKQRPGTRWKAVMLLCVVAAGGLAVFKLRKELPDPVQQAMASNAIADTQNEPKNKPAAPAAAAIATSKAPPATVHIVDVATADFAVNLSGLGSVQAFNAVVVKSRVDGQVQKITREEGQTVKEGDLLVQLDPAPFNAALNQALAKQALDQATYKNAKQDLDRTQVLTKSGYATPQLLDQRTAAVATASALLQVDAAAIDAARIQLAYTDIKSPISGVTGLRLVDPGNIVRATDTSGVMTINQLQPISVVFSAPEKALQSIIAAKDNGPVAVNAFSADGKTLLDTGELKLFDNQIDPATGTIKLKATFANAAHKLWPGLSVVTQLRVNTLKDVVVVPDSAVQRGPAGLYAYVVAAGGIAELRQLKVGLIADNRAVIEEGLAPGERVVTSGHYRIQPGSKLNIVSDAATQRGQTAQSE